MLKTKLMTGLLAAGLTIGAVPLYAGDAEVTLISTPAISTAISYDAPTCAATPPAAAWKAGWRAW